MSKRPVEVKVSNAVGVSAGTGLSGIVLMLPEGALKSVLVILCPTITVLAAGLWSIITAEIYARVADFRISSQKERAKLLYEEIRSDINSSPELVEKAKRNIDDLTLIEVEITRQRVEAIASPQ